MRNGIKVLQRLLLLESAPALFFLCLGIVGLIVGSQLPLGSVRRIGPGAFPVGISITLIIASLIFCLAEWGKRAEISANARAVAGVIASLLGFFVGYIWLGTIPAIIISICAPMVIDGRNSIKEVLGVAAVSSLFVYFVFIFWLKLPLPAFRGF